ncbi:hypothetical protein [Denitromonas ohlonensis]|jgi:hypothetical protein|uniref:Phage baseplate protein n=2 Tax=Denitromonas TaxID=139331 RepID=A0A558CR56_9RHOO|nr:hypothetical protein [Denitromonas ohlonensis]TVO67367.1 hypothetical protein FHP90_07075 [Denitromonas ohlonensis]TVO71986.1 hypothetical protein FHP89_19210 [Denitromonas ohlonensis]TVT51263.1 MAG: hypothetical protein FHP94_02880 [Denitromonas halophila]TVT74353.1 MAG: hypothetical protein FHP93_04520 [Denitromonas halophila]
MLAIRPERLLSVWEQGARRHPIDRALLLYALAAPEQPADRLADMPIGARNAALMALRRASFGGHLASWVDCPACGERMEFALDAADLPPAPPFSTEPIVVGGHRFRRPSSRHLAALVNADDPELAARQLLRECAESAEALPDDEAALAELLDAAEAAIEAADPWAELSLAVVCPACAHQTEASFDIASYLWEELDSHARRLLDDIHALAAAYGWTEPEVLALSDTRRAAYLARVRP